jgi:hypothetical protein
MARMGTDKNIRVIRVQNSLRRLNVMLSPRTYARRRTIHVNGLFPCYWIMAAKHRVRSSFSTSTIRYFQGRWFFCLPASGAWQHSRAAGEM